MHPLVSKNDIRQFAVAAIYLIIALPILGHGVTRYEGGQWFDGKAFSPATWYSVDGKLARTYDGPADAVIDLEGRFVIPPLAEGHTHDFSVGGNLERDLRRYLRNGIFYANNMNSIIPFSEPIRAKLKSAETVEVAWANAGITASGGHPVQIYQNIAQQIPGWKPSDMDGTAYFIVDSEKDLEQKWPRIISSHPDFLKAYLETSEEYTKRKNDEAYFGKRGLDPDLLKRLVALAAEDGLRVSVHVTSAADFRAAVSAGAGSIAHLPLERLTKDDAVQAAKRGVTVITTTLSHRPTDGIDDLDAIHAHNLRLLHGAGVRLAIGTDSGQTALDELLNVARLLPIDRAELLRIAGDTAELIFPDRRIGRLEPGYESSFLVLDANPLENLENLRKIHLRVKGGHLLEVTPEKRGIGELLIPLIMKEGAAAGLARYRTLEESERAQYDDSEAEINRIGYALLAHDRVVDAIVIFTFNTSNYPESANTWDSLGEAWMKKGDRGKAIEYYRRSLELDPKNENAREKLRELEADDRKG